ncbi:MAG TPA: hypothetical protein VI389_11355 [Geobacteraceae bacterium]
MKRLTARLALVLLIFPATASAVEVGTYGTTIVRFEERSAPGFAKERLVPATQFLGIDTYRLGDDNLSLHLYGWGRVDLADRSTAEKDTDADLSYGYLDYRFPKANGAIRAGRFFLYEGVAAEQLDGVNARADLAKGFTASVFGGAPVKLDRDGRSKGDYIVGGRMSYRLAGILEIGASGLHEGRVLLDPVSGVTDDRQLVGGDVWLSPHRAIEVRGRTVYSASTQAIAEHSYLLTVKPVPAFSVTGEYNENRLKDYFAFTNLRSLFNPDAGDTVWYYGASATYAVAKAAEVMADYRHYRRDTLGGSDRFGGELRLTFLDNKVRGGASYHRLEGASGINSFHELRGYVLYDDKKYAASIDAIEHLYKDNIYGRKSAYEIAGSIGYHVMTNLALSGDLSYGQNPQQNDELKGLVRLTFNYSTASKGAGK